MNDKKKPDPKCAWLDRDLIKAPYFCLCLSEKAYHKKLEHIGIPKHKWDSFTLKGKSGRVHYWEKSGKDTIAIVTMEYKKGVSLCAVFALLAHEAMHIWREQRMQMNEHDPSTEFEAYAIQAICLELFTSFCVQTGRKNLTCLAK